MRSGKLLAQSELPSNNLLIARGKKWGTIGPIYMKQDQDDSGLN